MDVPGSGLSMLDRIFETRSMHAVVKHFPTIFFTVPDTESAYKKVLDAMIKRGNGIDILSREYVRIQNRVFNHLMWFDTPFTFHCLPEDILYTPHCTNVMLNAAKTAMGKL